MPYHRKTVPIGPRAGTRQTTVAQTKAVVKPIAPMSRARPATAIKPGMLGSGAAEGAAAAIRRRKKMLEDL